MTPALRPVKLVGLSGSLRSASTNTGLLRAAVRRLPEGATMEIVNLSQLPLYHDDLWGSSSDDSGLPAPIREMRAKIQQADAIVFGNPEYNFSVSSVMKTAIDWGSKNPNVFDGKVGFIMGAGGGAGTARSAAHLHNICTYLNVHLLNAPHEILIPRFAPPANAWFDATTGDVVDKGLEDRIAKSLQQLVDLTRKLKA